MKTVLPICLAVLFAATSAALWVRDRSARADLAEARAALATLPSAPVVVSAPAETRVVEVAVERPAAAAPAAETAPAAPAPIDEAALEKAVQQRIAARDAEREAERERRRREWENASDEQREAWRREFQERMREHSQRRLAQFIEKTGLDDDQKASLEDELAFLNERIRETTEIWAAEIRESGSFGPETQLRLFSDVSADLLDGYAGMDEILPGTWRENDPDFNLLEMIAPTSVEPIFEAARDVGIRPPMGFPGGGPRGPRGPRGAPPPGPPQN